MGLRDDLKEVLSLAATIPFGDEGDFTRRAIGAAVGARCPRCGYAMSAAPEDVGRDGVATHPCRYCRQKMQADAAMPDPERPCAKCGGRNPPRASFCAYCGSSVDARVACRTCGGTGSVGRAEAPWPCPSCKGSPAVTVEPACATCGDLRKVGQPGHEVPCPSCRGGR